MADNKPTDEKVEGIAQHVEDGNKDVDHVGVNEDHVGIHSTHE